MSRAPAGSLCPTHPETPAEWTCPRCGRFFCEACAERTRPDATPMCSDCWALRTAKVAPLAHQSATRLQSMGLGLGIACVLPFWPLWIASVVLNIVALVKANEPPALEVRWKPATGLALSFAFPLAWVAVFVIAAS